MEKIYVLSLIIAGLVILPILYLLIKCSVEKKDTDAVILYIYRADCLDEEIIQKINELWWDEHFCTSSDAKEIIVVAPKLSISDLEKLRASLDKVRVLQEYELMKYLRTKTNEGRKAL